MRIYDNATPEGRKVDKPGADYCAQCTGRDGRHCPVAVVTYKTKKNGQKQKVKGSGPCPNDLVEVGVDG